MTTRNAPRRAARYPRPSELASAGMAALPPAVPAPASEEPNSLVARAMQEVLAVTYWFDPPPLGTESSPLLIRFSGRRADVEGPLQPGDRFVHDEWIEEVVPGSGPLAVTARIHGITPGAWRVTAQIQGTGTRTRGRRAHRESLGADAATRTAPALLPRLWRRWAPVTGPSIEAAEPVHTCLLPFARRPGIVSGMWGVMVALGIVLALVVQALLLARDHVTVAAVWPVWLLGIVGGAAGAKAWYIVLHRHEQGSDRVIGWCIQGFILGASLTAIALIAAFRLPAGVFLDTLAPGLLFAMAVGRIGCFFAGCCGGPPTASRWGVWSSDQRVGARRVPTQLMELALALGIGLVALGSVLRHGPAGGAFFVAALATYTLGRQGILRLRAEPRRTRWGGMLTAMFAAASLVGSIAAVLFFVR